ncbi:hypothetical protein PACTADRAFT_49585 [Pachysolen tannophilus NRRL Y-2460]|uniref:Mitochondrial outer membrane transport complex Sam37/metaxin N-terminal domain-containing protein n=1 Tax=Pachysolen tannophilus NRRL Y-2460 TaxID=669874 RepID=A0A1E4TWR1_PACTA|nr:hypothetical protein PACTADRAFT_49585 [Pachysolen tannophilus NRRL Y-2460]
MELHVWGSYKDGVISNFDPECLAAIYYIMFTETDVKVVPSSNSFNYKLPYLKKNDGEAISGYESIVAYLEKENGGKLDNWLSNEQFLLNNGLKVFIMDKIHSLTQYVLFLNKENYEQYTRGLFKKLLPFPMQYNAPLVYRDDAVKRCSNVGLNLDTGMLLGGVGYEDSTIEELLESEKKLKNTPNLTRLHSQKQQEKLNELLLRKNSINNMHCIHLAESYYNRILEFSRENNRNDDFSLFIFGEQLSSSDLLFFAQLNCQTLDVLPNNFMKIYLNFKFPNLIAKLEKFNNEFVNFKNLNIELPKDKDYPSLFNYIKTCL